MTTADPLVDVAVFRRLTSEQRALLTHGAEHVELEPGAQLFAEGEPAEGCWVVCSGHVALDTSVPGRGPVVLQTLGPGDVLGWSWLVPPHRWHYAASAVEPVTLLRLDTTWLRAHAEADPAFGYALALALFETLLARLQSTRARLLDLYRSPREH